MHTVETRDGMKVLVVTSMQDSASWESGEQVIIEGVTLEEPTPIVHYSEIARYYNIDARDIWPLVHHNAIGNRFAYNGGEKAPANLKKGSGNRCERYWKEIWDAAGNKTKVERIRRVAYEPEMDDGMYVQLKDLLYFADKQGWTKGGGKPKSKEHQQTQSDLSTLSQQITELTQLMGAFVQLNLDEKIAAKKAAK